MDLASTELSDRSDDLSESDDADQTRHADGIFLILRLVV